MAKTDKAKATTAKIKQLIIEKLTEVKGRPLSTAALIAHVRRSLPDILDYQVRCVIRDMVFADEIAGNKKYHPTKLFLPQAKEPKEHSLLAKTISTGHVFSHLRYDRFTKKADEILKYENAINKRIRSRPKRLLGSGTRGLAFELSNGKVLKLTDDVTEAKASIIILKANNPNKHIIHVYDVFQIDNLGIYGIVTEKIAPLPEEMEPLVNEIPFIFSQDSPLIHKIDQETLERYEDGLGEYIADEEWDIIKQILEGWAALHKLGIKYDDIHYNNIGIANNTVKILDLGYSRSAAKPIPKIESFLKWLGTHPTTRKNPK